MSLSLMEWSALDRAELACFEAYLRIKEIKKHHRHQFSPRLTSSDPRCKVCNLIQDDICHGAQL